MMRLIRKRLRRIGLKLLDKLDRLEQEALTEYQRGVRGQSRVEKLPGQTRLPD